MNRRGETTTFQERVEIAEHAAAGQTDAESAAALGCSIETIRKWRRIAQRRGRDGLTSHLGRPPIGPLGTLAEALRETIRHLRHDHPGWGPQTILAALRTDPRWTTTSLPSRSRVAAFLREEGLTRSYQRHSALPQAPAASLEDPHDEWQLDAQGIAAVAKVGKVCLINTVDVVSRLKVESYPSVGVNNPPTEDYFLTLRRAFLTYGLPRCISLDHGTVFYDNTTPSPFPTRLHLWLVALGVEVHFTRKRCPTDHAIVERTHQTMTNQALIGQTWADQAELWAGLDGRREVLNTQLPTRALAGQAPLVAYPGAERSGRDYRPEWEEGMLDLDRLYRYLAQGRWFRRARGSGVMQLGGYRYYVGRQWSETTIEVTFSPGTVSFLCRPEGSESEISLPAQGLTKPDLMGEAGRLLALPSYQLALPLSPAACRHQEYASYLAGTTS
jgi:transposase InsO family protein